MVVLLATYMVPLMLAVPLTSRVLVGAVVPMPTLPEIIAPFVGAAAPEYDPIAIPPETLRGLPGVPSPIPTYPLL